MAVRGKIRTASEGQHKSPVLWARWGRISRVIARTLRPRQPPVLILSLPRSGSSWVGKMLGSALNALYLREPVTQSDASFYDRGTVFALDPPDVAAAYRRLADKAFVGWPDFGPIVVRFPKQWALCWRRPRRVVIKEVNPLACGWYVRRYQPRVVFLMRHPAAVALSFHTQGWLAMEPGAWAKNGELQGRALSTARDALAGYPNCETVFFEALCAEPLSGFQRLFAFAHLMWTDWIQAFVRQHARNSKPMIDAWRGQVSPAALEALRDGYRQFGLAWYQGDDEW